MATTTCEGRHGEDLINSDLLKAAARACGYVWSESIDRRRAEMGLISLWIDGKTTSWDPLECSAAALDLAVNLRLDILHKGGSVFLERYGEPWFVQEKHADDAAAATRRAIVRAAAKLGTGVPVVASTSPRIDRADVATLAHMATSLDFLKSKFRHDPMWRAALRRAVHEIHAVAMEIDGEHNFGIYATENGDGTANVG